MLDAIVLSDFHLGASTCQVHAIQDFLDNLPPTARLILNGDILEHTEYRLTKQHWRVLSLLHKLSNQMELIWVRGNHDDDAESVAQLTGARFVREYMFVSGDKSVLCVHGDGFDRWLTDHPLLTILADWFYLRLQGMSRRLAIRVKKSSKIFIRCADSVRTKSLAHAKNKGANVVVCGHTHMMETSDTYFNTGCWTDHHCHYLTAQDGELHMVEVNVDVAAQY